MAAEWRRGLVLEFESRCEVNAYEGKWNFASHDLGGFGELNYKSGMPNYDLPHAIRRRSSGHRNVRMQCSIISKWNSSEMWQTSRFLYVTSTKCLHMTIDTCGGRLQPDFCFRYLFPVFICLFLSVFLNIWLNFSHMWQKGKLWINYTLIDSKSYIFLLSKLYFYTFMDSYATLSRFFLVHFDFINAKSGGRK